MMSCLNGTFLLPLLRRLSSVKRKTVRIETTTHLRSTVPAKPTRPQGDCCDLCTSSHFFCKPAIFFLLLNWCETAREPVSVYLPRIHDAAISPESIMSFAAFEEDKQEDRRNAKTQDARLHWSAGDEDPEGLGKELRPGPGPRCRGGLAGTTGNCISCRGPIAGKGGSLEFGLL